ncbi:hypothetical protein GCM10029964_036000 [Kibdelosporangium lantanae]
MTRAETKEHNRRALLAATRVIVARDGHRAKLDEIAAHAGLTTGAVYSLFGSKNDLFVALVADQLDPHVDRLAAAIPPDLGLVDAVAAFARYHHRLCSDPDALGELSFEVSLQDLAVRDPELRARLAASVRAHEERLGELFAGRSRLGPERARRLATVLRGLMVGLGLRAVLGLARTPVEQYVAAARALVSRETV